MSEPLDFNALMQQAQNLLAGASGADEDDIDPADDVFEGQAGGGAVTIAVNGALEFQSVTIAPAAVDPDDVELLQDLVLAALHDCTRQLDEEGYLGSGGGFDLGGLDLSAMFGGGGDDGGMPDVAGLLGQFGLGPPAGDDADDRDDGAAGGPVIDVPSDR